MTSFLERGGELAEVPLAAVLIEALNHRVTGVLSVDHGGGTSRLFLRDGVPVAAQSFAGFRPLGNVLLASGSIDVATLERSLAEMARSGRRQGEVLVAMGAVSQQEVETALARQQSAYLAQIAGLSAGRFSFDASAPVPAWTEAVRLAPLQAIVQALELPQASALVVSALQPVAGGALALAPGYGRLAGAFGWSADEAALVDRLSVLTTLDAFLADPGVAPERARAIVAALLLLGLASPRGGPPETVVPGLVVDLADLAGVAVDPVDALEPAACTGPGTGAAGGAAPAGGVPPAPARRSDPEAARQRRQRLLHRAMENMGVGPLAARPPSARPDAPPPARAPASASPAAGAARAATGGPEPAAGEAALRRALEAALPRAGVADLFDRLELPRTAGREQVKAAYFRLARQLHPDRFAGPGLADLAPRVQALFAALNEAYEVLSDDRRRAEYLAQSAEGPETARRAAAVEFQKAEACARTRDFARARGHFEAALRGDPRPEYQAAYAWMLYTEPRSPDRARARALVDQALRDPACDRAAYLGALLARDDGDDARAEALLRRVLEANPRHLDAERELRACAARRKARRTPGAPR